ncbi:DUF1553 domain-containing protein [Candidatus Laterigemmans baculatus]|uniref:DUF1553 domain-containing protein n=1 Tax=Candidatus Laterigemmans baculatus TaxID=2770505 RepID=UPI001F289C17|nr:DUF1553 domain-containing protein [Candidatus Laterigemmans baculatus]
MVVSSRRRGRTPLAERLRLGWFAWALGGLAVTGAMAVSGGAALADDEAAEAAEAAGEHSRLVLEAGPVGYWHFEDPASAAADRVSNAGTAGEELVGEVEGGVRLGEPGPRPPMFPRMDPENCGVELPRGGGRYVRVVDPGEGSVLDFQNGDAITIEAWVRPEPFSGGGHYYVLGKGRTYLEGQTRESHNYALRLSRVGGAAGLSFLFRSADDSDAGHPGDWHRWTSGGDVAIGDGWHHVAVSYEFGKPKSIRGYVDGQIVSGKWDMGGATEAAPVVDDDELWIGSSMGGSAGSSFQGGLDEVALYRTALSAEQIAERYRYVRPEPELELAEVPSDAVRVDIFEGLPNKKTWEFRPPLHTDHYETSYFAFLDVPKKYNERAIRIDRSNPFLIRASSRVTIPAGTQQVLVRCRNASRLYLDGELIAETAFHNISSSAHGKVFPYEPTLAPNLRPLFRGDTEAVTTIEGDGKEHLLQFEMIVGGQRHRPDFGETAVFLAPPGEDFRLVSHAEEVELTDADWMPFIARHRDWLIEFDAERRVAIGGGERDYWAERHAAARQAVLDRPRVEVPKTTGDLPVFNDIDRFIAVQLADSDEQPTPLTSDLEFLRRVTIDAIGVLPTEDQIERYLSDPPAERRTAAIDRLLEHPGWADNWVGYWQDVLAENPNIINPTLNNTGPFRWWIYESFLDNKPFDRFATELILMEGSERHGGPAGFAVASQNDAPMAEKAHIIGQAFLGLQMECARCHDAPQHDFLQEDLFSAAAMLNRGPQVVPKTSTVGDPEEVDSPFIEVTLAAGAKVEPKWTFDELVTEEDVQSEWLRNPKDLRERLALLVTAPQNDRFAQVIANRMWARYMGRGLVEPVDDWENAYPSHPELLDYLADELVLSGYDLKHVARLIFQSHAYQRRPFAAKEGGSYYYAGPAHRRMSAEQLVDSLFAGSGKPFDAGIMNIDIDGSRTEDSTLNLGYPRRAWMFASLSNERDRISLSLPFAQPFVTLLQAFGWRNSRQDAMTPHQVEVSVLQPAELSNGVLGERFTRLSDDSGFTELALEEQPLETLIERVYLRVLTRRPSAEEQEMFTALLRDGYQTRLTGEPPAPPRRLPRNKVGWTNQFDPEASRIQLELEEAVKQGDPPSPRLAADWRERMEDMLWTLMCSPEFIHLP